LFSISITFKSVLFQDGTKEFWESFGMAIDAAAAVYRRGSPKGPTTPISSRSDFVHYFRAESWKRNVVLLVDELSSLHSATPDVRDDFLQAIRSFKFDRDTYAIQCLIAAGTFSIVYLNPSTATIPPFNVASIVQTPYFSIDETRKLFREFAEDLGFPIDDGVVEDVWAKSNG
jgi:hypothetical protein